MKDNREGERILAGINKNITNKKWRCIIENCGEEAINSHIYQQNGILNNVADNGHLMEVKPIDVFKWNDKKLHEITSFKRVGISQAFSYPTLCNHHDTTIFLDIERHPVNLDAYENQLLFFFRTLLSTKRKTQIVMERESRISQSNVINANPNCKPIVAQSLKNIQIINHLLSRHDGEISRMENDIAGHKQSFIIKKFDYELIKAYGMSMNLSPESNNFVYTNVFPYNGRSVVLLGTLSENMDSWTEKYFDSWSNLDNENFEVRLTTFLSKNSENWGLSPDIVTNINQEALETFYKLKAEVIAKSVLSDAKFLFDLDFRTEYNFFANKNYGS